MSRSSFVLGREWVTASEIRTATGWKPRHARRVLERLQQRGLIDRTVRADGTPLWRRAARERQS